MGGSGSNPSPEKDPPSALPSRSEVAPSQVRHHVLIVEDNESDVFLMERAISAKKLPLYVHVVKDGDQAVRFFNDVDRDPSKPCPDLVILDINLPRRPGDDVLKHMRRSSRCADAHVIAVSTSDSPRDRRLMAQLGADQYFHKPSDFDEFMKLGDLIQAVIAKL